jgi:hypothetical protein
MSEYKIAKPRTKTPGVKRVALLPDNERGWTHVLCLVGDIRALIPMGAIGFFQSEREAMEECEERFGIPPNAWVQRSSATFHDAPDRGSVSGKTCVLGDEAAARLCRTPKVSVAKMLQVFTWAESRPSPEKIQLLLILETENWASSKGLHCQFHSALQRCAVQGADPLWDTIARDYDHSRILRAIQALILLNDAGIVQRLIDLGESPLDNTHWSDIREAAAKHGLPIPPEIAEIQWALTGLPAGPWQWFRKRRDCWPKHLDVNPEFCRVKRPVLQAIVDDAAQSRARRLTDRLRRLESVLRSRRADIWEEFQRNPGATKAQLADLSTEVFGGMPLPPDLSILYQWHLGNRLSPIDLTMDSGFYPMALPQAVEEWRQLADFRASALAPSSYQKSWFPVFADGMGNHLVLETQGKRAGQLIEHWHDELGCKRRFHGLDEWAVFLSEFYAAGPKSTAAARQSRVLPSHEPIPESMRFEVDAASLQFTSYGGSPRKADIEVLEIGTILLVPGHAFHAAIKLAEDCWCLVRAGVLWRDPETEVIEAMKILARRVSNIAWRTDDATIHACFRRDGASLMLGRTQVAVIDARPGE